MALTKGTRVRVVESATVPKHRRDFETDRLIGLSGIVTGRWLNEMIEVKILAPSFSPKPFGFLMDPSELVEI